MLLLTIIQKYMVEKVKQTIYLIRVEFTGGFLHSLSSNGESISNIIINMKKPVAVQDLRFENAYVNHLISSRDGTSNCNNQYSIYYCMQLNV